MHSPHEFYYCAVGSKFGDVIVVGRYADQKVVRIFLPGQHSIFKSSAYKSAVALRINDKVVGSIGTRISKMLQGKPAVFSLDVLDWKRVYPFQKQVLRLEYRIPRGMVSTYGRLASKLHHPRAARAVGTALARNPFPIIIPCHRTIRSDRSMGGYAGGLAMKRWLLESEGVKFDRHGCVVTDRFW